MGYDPGGNLNWGNIFKAALVVVAVTAAVVAVVATAGAVAVAAGVASTAVVTAATTGAAVGGIAAGASEIVSQCVTKGSDNLDYNSIAIETFVGAAHGAVDGIAGTATKAGTRIACKAGKVAINAFGTAVHSINQGKNTLETLGDVGKSVASSISLQTILLGYDGITGKLNNDILSLYWMDGKLTYGVTNMLATAGIRILSNGWRTAKGILSLVF